LNFEFFIISETMIGAAAETTVVAIAAIPVSIPEIPDLRDSIGNRLRQDSTDSTESSLHPDRIYGRKSSR
jgi:hypothetical protein